MGVRQEGCTIHEAEKKTGRISGRFLHLPSWIMDHGSWNGSGFVYGEGRFVFGEGTALPVGAAGLAPFVTPGRVAYTQALILFYTPSADVAIVLF